MRELIGKEVEVGTGYMTYCGKLMEVGEAEVHVETESGWVAVPVSQVVFIRRKEGGSFAPEFDFEL